jgi:hypothetical protein
MIEELARYTGMEVAEVDATFVEKVTKQPLAQNRTSSNKPFTHVWGKEIYKGPYSSHSLRSINNLRYPYLISVMEQILRLQDCRRGVFRWRGLGFCQSGQRRSYYLVGHNVGRLEGMRTMWVSTRVDQECRVVERGTLVKRVSELEKVKERGRFVRHPAFDERVAIASLQHLYFRYLLNLGDSGTHNILIREDWAADGRVIAGIDFDDQRSAADPRTALGCIFKNDYSYLQDIYGEYLAQIVLLEGADVPLKRTIEEVNEFCRKWADALPAARRQELLSASTLRIQDILDRNERFRGLLSGTGSPVAAR